MLAKFIIRKYYESVFQKLHSIQETDSFWERHKLLKLTQELIEDLNN